MQFLDQLLNIKNNQHRKTIMNIESIVNSYNNPDVTGNTIIFQY